MELTIKQVLDATTVLTRIINDNRAMPQKAAYRLAYLRRKLLPAYETAVEQGRSMVDAYGYHAPLATAEDPLAQTTVSDEFSVPPDKRAEHDKAWNEFVKDTVEIAGIKPIPLEMFFMGEHHPAVIHTSELALLEDLIAFDVEDEPHAMAA